MGLELASHSVFYCAEGSKDNEFTYEEMELVTATLSAIIKTEPIEQANREGKTENTGAFCLLKLKEQE